MIAEGRIALNGEKLTTPATLLENLAGVTVDGQPVKPPTAARLFLFYKPAGALTAARDPKGRPTIYDKLPPYEAMALGAGDTTVMRMAVAYAEVVNGGKQVSPVMFHTPVTYQLLPSKSSDCSGLPLS